MANTLAPDSTLLDLSGKIDDLEDFVRQVFGVMRLASKEHGAALIMRLGITGAGRAPNYRLEMVETGQAVMAIDGANHRPWPDGSRFDAPANWSSSTMTLEQVQQLLGDIRGWRGAMHR
ncbi:hypothetical protein [Novosphingobium sp. MMS21-SN21R]|uniref:hypothetical protein n=1 Tax=Novosphingobium sp. MMS21-SN21R TaxID=2969298 RepID=UPI0028841EF2|nr:hypothetical protein [Novosphingobium sp. MMS21-SN21R]MDT0507602.1 hypothetical protein [Novosphingobium sp. MMS21-SN21R]